MCVWHILSRCDTVCQRQGYTFTLYGRMLQSRYHALTTQSQLRCLCRRQVGERFDVAAWHHQSVAWARRVDVQKCHD